MDNIDFASLPDAEAARLMAEMDGWRVERQKNGGWKINGPQCQSGGFTKEENAWREVFFRTNYPRSLDAAVGWLGRMGLEWIREAQQDGPTLITVYDQHFRGECEESSTCPTPRALCNAGWVAVKEREAANG